MLTLQRLRMVEAVAREGTVTAAAESLHVSQSAVSHGVRRLERHLGIELFERRGHRMAPTASGHRLARAAERVASELAAARREVEAIRDGQAGVLRVTTECYTSYHWLPHVLRAFRSAHPRVELLIVPEYADAPLEAVEDGRADLAIVHNLPRAGRLASRSLGADELVLVVAAEHPLASRSHILPGDLEGETLLLHTEAEVAEVRARFLRPAGVEPARALELRMTEAVLSGVRAGLGVSIMARWVVRPQLPRGDLVAVSLSEAGITRTWYVAYRAEDEADRVLGDLVELMMCDDQECGPEPSPVGAARPGGE